MSPSQATAANIRALMAWRRLSGRELARTLGMEHNKLARRLNGKQTMSIDDVMQIAAALGVPAASLIPDDLPAREGAA